MSAERASITARFLCAAGKARKCVLGARRRQAFTALLTSVALLAVATTAHASSDPLGSGTTKLTLDKGFARLLAAHGVELTATAPANRRDRAYTLPVSGGALDPAEEKGEIQQQGTLIFRRGARRVPLREIVVKTKPEPLIAKVGGGQLKLASTTKRRFARAGFGSSFTASGLRLSAKLATRLAKKLRLHGVFAGGQRLGTLRSSAQPVTVAILSTGRATFAPDPAFLAKLDQLFISLNPIAPAERSPGPIFSVPIIGGGALAPDASAGTLRSGGSLEFLQLGAGQIFWHELWLDPGTHQVLAEADIEPTPTLPGKLGQVPVLTLGAGTLASNPSARTIAISAAPLTLTATTAAYFNQTFATGKEAFAPGELLGTVSFSAQTQ
jgi:hypothetical protein